MTPPARRIRVGVAFVGFASGIALTAGACGTPRESDAINENDHPAQASPLRSPSKTEDAAARLRKMSAVASERFTSEARFSPSEDRARMVAAVASPGNVHRAHVELPNHANEEARVIDLDSPIEARFTLQGASAAPLVIADGVGVYANAIPGADLFHRVTAFGTEDRFFFETKPAREEISYDVDVSRATALRLVGNVVELLDEGGAPRIRVSAPWVKDENGKHPAAVSLVGCAHDQDPRGPWGRSLTPKAGSHCTLTVSWRDVSYPLVVDPEWVAAGATVFERFESTSTLLLTGRVLAAGEGPNGGTYSVAAELYDPATRTWATTGTMDVPRGAHSAAMFTTGSLMGKVLLVGGEAPTNDLYDPATGTFATTATFAFGRYTTSTLLANGKILVVGDANQTTAHLYDPATLAFTTTGALTTPRNSHVAVLLPSGKVLIAGGFANTGSDAGTAAAEVYDPTTNTFTPTATTMTAPRGRLTGTLVGGKVLIAGGLVIPAGKEPVATGTAEIYDPATNKFTATGSMTTARGSHSALLLTAGPGSGSVLIAGGTTSGPLEQSPAIASTELYDATKGTFTLSASLVEARYTFPLTMLPSGIPLANGGLGSPGVGYAQLGETYEPTSAACKADADCGSKFCVEGVCCNTACTEVCNSCVVAGLVGTCSPTKGAPVSGKACTAASSALCSGGCDGITGTKCTYPGRTKICDTACSMTEEIPSTCDGAGQCVVAKAQSCAGHFACQGNACETACIIDRDCETGYFCVDGPGGKTCAGGATCSDDHTSTPLTGKTTDCTPYKCGTSGSCLGKCASVDDCVSPAVCDPTGKCVANNASSGGCTLTARTAADESPWTLAALFAIALGRRKSMKREGRS